MKYPKEQVAEAMKRLKETIKPGDAIGTIVTHVARSGMSRNIKLYHVDGSQMCSIGWDVSRVLGYPITDNHEVKVGGCGMDMGFHIVYNLSSVLFRDAYFCTGEECTSNDHRNDKRRNYRAGRKHSDAVYALKQRWI